MTSPAAGPYPLPTQHAGQAASEWQIAEAYEFTHISIPGMVLPFSTVGFNSSVVRFFGRSLGVEGDLGAGFGSPPHSGSGGASAASIFVGAGPRIALRSRRHFEPWGHGLVGVQHFSFGGANLPPSATSLGWVAGGGVDYRFDSGLGLRVQADYLGSHFSGAFQRNLRIVAGFVWNF